jgi:hypothetical protein
MITPQRSTVPSCEMFYRFVLNCVLSSRVKVQKASLLLTAVPSAPCHLKKACEERRNNPSRFFDGGYRRARLGARTASAWDS